MASYLKIVVGDNVDTLTLDGARILQLRHGKAAQGANKRISMHRKGERRTCTHTQTHRVTVPRCEVPVGAQARPRVCTHRGPTRSSVLAIVIKLWKTRRMT
jgi:hypothetical protein